MKNKIKAIALTLAVAALSSCGNDWLDLTPSNGLPSDKAITNYADALVARSGMYDGLQGSSSNNDYYATRMFFYGDVSGDDMQARAQGMRSSSAYEKRFTLDDAPTIWKTPYNVIRRANRIIEAINLKKVSDATAAQQGQLNAEALTVRALVHFDLVKVYSKPYTMDNGASLGIPIVLTPLNNENLPGRASVAEVYTQVISDLTSAINSGFLVTGKTPGYINLWAAKALLCRVYLYHNDNTKALQVAEDVIENSGYKLWENEEYVNGWQSNAQKGRTEMLLEINNFSSDDWADREGIAYLLHENGYADAILTQSFTDLLNEDPQDIRHGITLAASTNKDLMKAWGDAKIFINKFPADGSGEMRLNSLPILRLSEVYLNAAEAAAKVSNSDAAQKYLDAIVNRANKAKHISKAEATLDRVLKERRKELVGEGQRFFDAMRNNETIVRYTETSNRGRHYPLNKESQSFGNTYFRALLPIPIAEVNANPILRAQQNPGY